MIHRFLALPWLSLGNSYFSNVFLIFWNFCSVCFRYHLFGNSNTFILPPKRETIFIWQVCCKHLNGMYKTHNAVLGSEKAYIKLWFCYFTVPSDIWSLLLPLSSLFLPKNKWETGTLIWVCLWGRNAGHCSLSCHAVTSIGVQLNIWFEWVSGQRGNVPESSLLKMFLRH